MKTQLGSFHSLFSTGFIKDFQPAFTCSNLTLETLEQGVKYVEGNNKDTRTAPMALVWCLYC